jgi:hypothetical protein
MGRLVVVAELETAPLLAERELFDTALEWKPDSGADEWFLVQMLEDEERAKSLIAGGDTVRNTLDSNTGETGSEKIGQTAAGRWCTGLRVEWHLSKANFPPPRTLRTREKLIRKESDRLRDVLERRAQTFYAAARVRSGQALSGLSRERVRVKQFVLAREGAPTYLHRSWVGSPVKVIAQERQILTAEHNAAAWTVALEGGETDSYFEASLLADARYIAMQDERYAVLIGAMALELRVKRILRAGGWKRKGEGDPQSVAQLFDLPLDAVIGTSLRYAKPRLWAEVGKLFAARNDIAHEGTGRSARGVTGKNVKTWLDAAEDVMDWLFAAERSEL